METNEPVVAMQPVTQNGEELYCELKRVAELFVAASHNKTAARYAVANQCRYLSRWADRQDAGEGDDDGIPFV